VFFNRVKSVVFCGALQMTSATELLLLSLLRACGTLPQNVTPA